MKKTVAFLLTWILGLSLLTACQKRDAGQEEAQPAPNAQGSEASPSANTERKDSWLCDEKTTLTVFTYDRINNSFEIPSNDLPFWQAVLRHGSG